MIEIINRWKKTAIYAGEHTSQREAVLAAKEAKVDLSGADLSGADLSGAECLTAQGDFLRLAGTRHALIAIDESNISIGCMRNTLAWWRENYAVVGVQQGYTPKQIEEYRMHIEYAAQWLAALKGAA